MIKELLDVAFPNYRTTTYCKVLQSILREQHNELKVKVTEYQLSKELIFCIFDKNDVSKNKIKQNNNKVKDWKRETPLAEIFCLPDNGARKLIGGAVLM
jgi:hypothetical protein